MYQIHMIEIKAASDIFLFIRNYAVLLLSFTYPNRVNDSHGCIERIIIVNIESDSKIVSGPLPNLKN